MRIDDLMLQKRAVDDEFHRAGRVVDQAEGGDRAGRHAEQVKQRLRLAEGDAAGCADDVMDLLQVDLGLLIHEGQLTYGEKGLKLIADMGAWWYEQTGLPLPLGGNVVRKDLGKPLIETISRHLHASIAFGLDHRRAALDHSMKYARGLDRGMADTFVGMYVNDWTLDYGAKGREAVRKFLARGVEAGIIDRPVDVTFVGD